MQKVGQTTARARAPAGVAFRGELISRVLRAAGNESDRVQGVQLNPAHLRSLQSVGESRIARVARESRSETAQPSMIRGKGDGLSLAGNQRETHPSELVTAGGCREGRGGRG